MLRRLLEDLPAAFGRRRHPPVVAERLIYVVGDIHGRIDLLMPLVDRVFRDAMMSAVEGEVPELVFVGDMIDRGPDTRDVLEMMLSVQSWPEMETHFLSGNHEEMLLKFLEDPVEHRDWLRFGGYETLQSYGFGRVGDLGERAVLEDIAQGLHAALGAHLAFLQDLSLWHRNGNLVVTHAGAVPTLALEDQPVDALIWGTPAFTRQRRADGLWVVHGHTVVDTPLVRDGRISIDTGAYRTGRLSVLKVQGSEISFLTEIGAPGGQDT